MLYVQYLYNFFSVQYYKLFNCNDIYILKNRKTYVIMLHFKAHYRLTLTQT